ncbi:MAG TPA: hypothetical protein VMS02_01855 [Solirubrobacteraceae bacterium]|nr:hypothetical protein [Solirubrobacteraceae bacterium]
MNGLLQSLKSDLLDRRLLPFLLLLGAVLAAAVAYAVLGGSSSPSSPAPTAVTSPRPTGSTLAVSQAPGDPHAAVSETTDGQRYQHHAGNRNPFTPLPSKGGSASSSSTSSTSSSTGGSGSTTSSSGSTASGSGSTGSSSSGASGSGGSTPTTPAEPAPSKPAPPKQHKQPVYLVAALFGLAPTTPGQLSQLTPYDNLRRLEPLPNPSEPRVVFAGVTDAGKSALFALAGEAILKGEGTCVPSPTQCEAVALQEGKSEELSYLVGEQTVSYELHIVSIAKREASAARAARLNRRDRAGEALVRRLAPAVLRKLRFSSAKSVLVYAAQHGA